MTENFDNLFHCMICISLVNSILFGIHLIITNQYVFAVFILIIAIPSLLWCVKNYLMVKT